jgi:hypothetical protein
LPLVLDLGDGLPEGNIGGFDFGLRVLATEELKDITGDFVDMVGQL